MKVKKGKFVTDWIYVFVSFACGICALAFGHLEVGLGLLILSGASYYLLERTSPERLDDIF